MQVSRISQIQARKSVVLDELFEQVARESDFPMAAAAWDEVLDEIGHEADEVSAFLVDGLSSGEEEIVELWCRLEAEALSLELLTTIALLWQLRSKATRTYPP